jgi:hypothetical protein
MGDSMEFYLPHEQSPFLRIGSSFQPNDGDLINIRGQTYKVLGRSFTVDYADSPLQRGVRCNVIVQKEPK